MFTFEHARHVERRGRATAGELAERKLEKVKRRANEEVDAEVGYEKGT